MTAAVPAGLLARETAISAVINAAISAGFFFAVFGLGAPVSVWGVGNYAFDFLPQSLAVTFFASFVPAVIMTRTLATGQLIGPFPAPTITALLLGALARALAGLVLGGAIWAAVLWATDVATLAPSTALSLKMVYGALLGAAVTYRTLLAMFAKRSARK